MDSDSLRPVLGERTLGCENTRFRVFLDQLLCDGQPYVGDYLVVEPKRMVANLVSGGVVLPVCEGQVGLIKVYRHPIRAYSWEVPRGFLDEGEWKLNVDHLIPGLSVALYQA